MKQIMRVKNVFIGDRDDERTLGSDANSDGPLDQDQQKDIESERGREIINTNCEGCAVRRCSPH